MAANDKAENRAICRRSSTAPSAKTAVGTAAAHSAAKPATVTPEAGKRSTGCWISAVLSVATAKPKAMPKRPSAITCGTVELREESQHRLAFRREVKNDAGAP